MRAKIVIGVLFCLIFAGCVITARPARVHPAPAPPSRVVAVAEPRLVFIPEAQVYYAPDVVEVDLFFYGGIWYRFHGGVWYTCSTHRGPWRVVAGPPEVFHRIPPGHAKHHIVKPRKAPPAAPERGHAPERKPRR